MEQNGKEFNRKFRKDLLQLALPVTLQCLLQSSFSVIDQVMTGQLGSVSIAAVGLSGKFIYLLTVMVQAITAVAGIIMAQAIGKREAREVGKGFYTNLMLAAVLTITFTIAGLMIPEKIMGIYTEDQDTLLAAVTYLRIYAISFIPMLITSMLSAYLRCVDAAVIPLYAGIGAAVINTGLNYVLIFGKAGCPKMGIQGAAWASVISQMVGAIFMLCIFLIAYNKKEQIAVAIYHEKEAWKRYLHILIPTFICEFVWVLGENVYGFLYGHMGTKACAAMTLINPIVSLLIGALSGVSQAAGIMIGKLLGAGEKNEAYMTSKKLMKTGFICSILMAGILLLCNSYYVLIFNVEPDVRAMTSMILIAFAILSPVKVQNMILGGGILRSGGKTEYIMAVDMIGTWGFGVPLGFITAFVLKLPVAYVYFILSLEEVVRLLISVEIFRRKKWMQKL